MNRESLIELHALIVWFLKQAGYRDRLRIRHLAAEREARKKLGAGVKRWLGIVRRQARQQLGELEELDVERVADWTALGETGERMLRGAYLEILRLSIAKEQISKQAEEAWSWIVNVQVVEWAKSFAAIFIKQILEETKKAVRSIIVEGIAQGLSMPAINMRLRPIVGLNDRLAGAVNRYATELYTRPKWAQLSDEDRYNRIERYAQKLQRYREDNIARTETARAMDEGTLLRYKESGIRRVKPLIAPDACPKCRALEGNEYSIEEASGILPLHPSDRCGWEAVL